MSRDSFLTSELLLQGVWVALSCAHTSLSEGWLSCGHTEDHDCLLKATVAFRGNVFMEMVLLWRAPEKPLVRSDPSRAEEQSGFLLQPLSGPFTFRAAVEPRDSLAQHHHAKSQGQSMGLQAGLFPEHRSTWEPRSPLSKAPSQPSLLPPHSSVRQWQQSWDSSFFQQPD